MFTFHDTAHQAEPDNQPGTQGGSPTPIFDRLIEEWQRMFRAVPGDRFGEGSYPQTAPHTAYGTGNFPYPAPAPHPSGSPAYDTYSGRLPRHGRSELALTPVASYQTQHLPL